MALKDSGGSKLVAASKLILPKHLGFIPDGCKTWATQQNLPALNGYYQGIEVLKNIAIMAIKNNVPYVSGFLFSIDDWKRSKSEVTYRMRVILQFLEKSTQEFIDENIKLVFIGSRDGLPKPIINALDKAVKQTEQGSLGSFVLCINYSGQQEIVDATKKMLRHNKDPRRLSARELESFLYEPQIPPVDLVVRTSGEYSTSGFMLWRAAQAEYTFVDKLWPDFSKPDLRAVLLYYAHKKS